MQTVTERNSAQILPFVRPQWHANRLTAQDQIDALEWDASHAASVGARLAIFGRQVDDAPEVGDYISIYRADERWAVWGAAREGKLITVWHGPSGSDIGKFSSMKDALASLALGELQIRGRAQPKARRPALSVGASC